MAFSVLRFAVQHLRDNHLLYIHFSNIWETDWFVGPVLRVDETPAAHIKNYLFRSRSPSHADRHAHIGFAAQGAGLQVLRLEPLQTDTICPYIASLTADKLKTLCVILNIRRTHYRRSNFCRG